MNRSPSSKWQNDRKALQVDFRMRLVNQSNNEKSDKTDKGNDKGGGNPKKETFQDIVNKTLDATDVGKQER